MTYRLLDLFSGIGGFSLGLERSRGFKTVAFCEIEPFCRKVLAKHWPDVPIYDDVRTLTADRLRADGIGVDAICGGFPCQDISVAGKGAGIDGERSGLWSEYARLIGELRPRLVIVENVAALLGRGLERVLGDLAALGFDAEWHCIPASAVGAPHLRDRIWLVAYPQHTDSDSERPYRAGVYEHGGAELRDEQERFSRPLRPAVADTPRLQSRRTEQRPKRQRIGTSGQPSTGADPEAAQRRGAGGADDSRRWDQEARRLGLRGDWAEYWFVEPNVGRVAHGVPSRVDRLKSLGNAVVPQIPELIGRAILAAARQAA